ncbi:class I SAM-dependent methyltransferase [Desulfonema magnum]|nr:class I SAM-dependent methyltransferase [Desulfonema magnum]
MWLPFRIAFGNKARHFLDFKDQAAFMSDDLISDIYAKTSSVSIQQNGTDLSDVLIRMINSNITGESVLDAGCGKGVLARHLSKQYKVTACDIWIDKKTADSFPEIQFKQANIEKLPFGDREFDTVICTHTLEHVRDIFVSLNELRRVARKRLILVLPIERPYQYTFNLHLHFFPYRYLVVQLFRYNHPASACDVREIDGCWYCQEDKIPSEGSLMPSHRQ